MTHSSYHGPLCADAVAQYYGHINSGSLSCDLSGLECACQFVESALAFDSNEVDLSNTCIPTCIWKLDGFKSSRLDGWTRNFISLFLPELRLPLEQLFRLMLRTGIIPACFDDDPKKVILQGW